MIHFGQKIKDLVESRDYPKATLASQLAMSEGNLYKIFRKAHIDTEILEKICQIFQLKMDYFFTEDNILHEPSEVYQKPESQDKIIIDYQKKIIELQEKIIKLTEDKKDN